MTTSTSDGRNRGPVSSNFPSRIRRRMAVLVSLCLAVLGTAGLFAPAAQADTDPEPGTPETVSADALPTWQLNGVVWSQVVVGNKVYATGSFTQARPPGVGVGGPGSMPANNLFVYDITTGQPISGFQHSLNAQGLVVKASPDGTRVYVGGDFTSVDGAARDHIVALRTDNGSVDANFAASVSGQVRGIAVSNETVYVGGNFFRANGNWLRRLAAFSRTNGARRNWAPTADDDQVMTMVMSPDGSRVIVGGKFTTLSGEPAHGLGAIDADTAAILPFAADGQIRNGGSKSAILGLTTDGTNIYGSGFAFGTGNFEGTFAARPNTGEIVFANDCHGDTYDTYPSSSALYSAGHAHGCQWMGAFPDVRPRVWHHALAFDKKATGVGTGPDSYGWNYNGVPTSSILQWFPDLDIGSFTGQSQAAWSVAGNDDYLVMGGEFPRVNGTAQQGLVRLATKDNAPNQRGPVQAPDAQDSSALSLSGGTVRVSWEAAYDMDNEDLSYEVYRTGTPEPVYSTTQKSNFWTRPVMGFSDRGVAADSSYRYTIRISDSFGNTRTLTTNQVTVGSGSSSQYVNRVIDDGATAYWRLGEVSGSTIYDHAGFNDAVARGGVSRGTAGAIPADSDTASTFSGGSSGYAVSSAMEATPDFTVEAWIKTTSTSGGKILGYGNSTNGNSSSYDRHVYMDNGGRLVFGVYPGSTRTVRSGDAYNDGEWHYVVASLSADNGMKLYVDGDSVASDPGTTSAQDYNGYWRIGGDNLNGWPNRPSSDYLSGAIDEVAVYSRALNESAILSHYGAGGGDVPNLAPQAEFDTSTSFLNLAVDASTSTDPDGSVQSYDWDWGDGSSPGSGQMDEHTFAEPGDYTVTLTVTDDEGESDSVSHDVTVTANEAPEASFAVSSEGRQVSVDASDSSDSDGSIESYDWDWGDGSDHDSGETAEHTYDSDGTVTITLTVTDDQGKESSATEEVSVERVNSVPEASFAATSNQLVLSVDGSSSSDPDGSVDSYDWDWGDGSNHGSGETDEHTFQDEGDYTVTLTVTDNEGGTATAQQQVSVSAAVQPFVVDSFERSETRGWGNAEIGGEWSRTGSPVNFSVVGGTGQITMPNPGAGPSMNLSGSPSDDTDLRVTTGTDVAASGGGVYLTVRPREIDAANSYYSNVRLMSDGRVQLILGRRVNGNTVLDATVVPGLTLLSPADRLDVRVQAFGTSPTTLRAKVWKKGDTEPPSWTLSVQDGTPSLQSAGTIELGTFLSGSADDSPVTALFDDLWVGPTDE